LDGVGFFILDEPGVATVAGGGRARDNNIAAGNPVQPFRGAPNQQEANFRATAPMYKLIIFNESPNDAIFTMEATNAYIVGENENVSDPNAAMADDAMAADDTVTAEAGDDTATAGATADSYDGDYNHCDHGY
jgi:hypothetical protein